MDKEHFFCQLAEVLRMTDSIHESDRLQDLEGWDSIGALSVIALVDESYGVTLDVGELWKCQTVGHLMKLVTKDR